MNNNNIELQLNHLEYLDIMNSFSCSFAHGTINAIFKKNKDGEKQKIVQDIN